MEELANFDASEFQARRINAKEIMTPSVGIFHLPNRRWNEKFLEEVRESARSEDLREDLQGNSEKSQPRRRSLP